MFTDVVESTAKRTALGDDGFDTLRRAHDVVIRRVVEAHQGHIVKFMGDGVLAMFSSASNRVLKSGLRWAAPFLGAGSGG
jgi:class 3 adenylate cyclase